MGKFRAYVVITTLFLFLLALAPPASADHTNPRTPLAPTEGTTATGIVRGGGTWKHIANFPGGASNALTGGGTDLEFFNVGKQVYGAFGTLGQDDVGSVGQRFIQLTQKGQVAPRWVADHGSGHCTTSNPSGTTGLQHDTQIARKGQITLLTDTTDATGRCHDPNGGGIEIVDVSKIGIRRFQPSREVHLVRFAGFSHTHTVDGRFPWIVYNSSSDFSGRNWIDVMDMNSCFGSSTWTLAQRRAGCRPTVARIPFQDTWTQQRDQNTNELEPGSADVPRHHIPGGTALLCRRRRESDHRRERFARFGRQDQGDVIHLSGDRRNPHGSKGHRLQWDGGRSGGASYRLDLPRNLPASGT